MKKIILGISLVLFVAMSVFAFVQGQEAKKLQEKIIIVQSELSEQTKRAERLKTIAEQQAAKAVDAEAQVVLLKEQLENCLKR